MINQLGLPIATRQSSGDTAFLILPALSAHPYTAPAVPSSQDEYNDKHLCGDLIRVNCQAVRRAVHILTSTAHLRCGTHVIRSGSANTSSTRSFVLRLCNVNGLFESHCIYTMAAIATPNINNTVLILISSSPCYQSFAFLYMFANIVTKVRKIYEHTAV